MAQILSPHRHFLLNLTCATIIFLFIFTKKDPIGRSPISLLILGTHTLRMPYAVYFSCSLLHHPEDRVHETTHIGQGGSCLGMPNEKITALGIKNYYNYTYLSTLLKWYCVSQLVRTEPQFNTRVRLLDKLGSAV